MIRNALNEMKTKLDDIHKELVMIRTGKYLSGQEQKPMNHPDVQEELRKKYIQNITVRNIEVPSKTSNKPNHDLWDIVFIFN